MNLTKDQKSDLKSLTEHRGFKVLEEIMKDMEYELLKKFKTVNLAEKDIWIELNWVQNKLSWAEYLIDTAKAFTKVISKKKSD